MDIDPRFYRTGLGTVVEKNPKKTYPHLYGVFLLDSHNTKLVLYKRGQYMLLGTYT